MCFFDILPIAGYITSSWYYDEDLYYVKIPKPMPDVTRLCNLIKRIKALGHHVYWIPSSEFRQIKLIENCANYENYSAQWYDFQYSYTHYVHRTKKMCSVVLIPIGTPEEMTQEFEENFIKTYTLSTRVSRKGALQNLRYLNKYYQLIDKRHQMIRGFTERGGKNYMVANWIFHYYYLLYGFCSKCGQLRCTPVWCTCGQKQLSYGWTSNNKQLDEFIRETQKKSEFIFEPFLEWIPY